jgi:hypothetical protein
MMAAKKKTKTKKSKTIEEAVEALTPRVSIETRRGLVNWKKRALEAEKHIEEHLEPAIAFYDSKATHDALMELVSAQAAFPPMHSMHEGYAILKEEVDELWEAVRVNPGPHPVSKENHRAFVRMEAVQVAAMALRFIKEICDGEMVS